MLGRENAQDGVDDRGLADPRSAGDHQNLGSKCPPDRRSLTFGERQVDALLNPWNGLVWIDRSPGKVALRKRQQPFGNSPFGAIQTCKENAVNLTDLVGDDGPLGQFEIERRTDQILRYLKE